MVDKAVSLLCVCLCMSPVMANYWEDLQCSESDNVTWTVDPTSECDMGEWEGLVKECGACKGLVSNAQTYKTCSNYCDSFGLGACIDGWEDINNDQCDSAARKGCDFDFAASYGTDDMICQCAGMSHDMSPLSSDDLRGLPSCTRSSPRCKTRQPFPNARESVPSGGYTVGFVGDTGSNSRFDRVLRICRERSARMIIHAGDHGYTQNNPTTWNNRINSRFSSSFPYLSALGNHDTGSSSGWSLTQSRTALYRRIRDQKCTGQTGVNVVCAMNGLTIVLSGVGEIGSGHTSFITAAFRKYPNRWRICVWHKNQRSLQAGNKRNSVGYTAYETCRQYGAMVITGHQHEYARSKTISNFRTQSHSSSSSSISVRQGRSFVVVTGVGGWSARTLDRTLSRRSHWAVTLGKGSVTAGVLLCRFSSSTASCHFRDITGSRRDTFTVTSTTDPNGSGRRLLQDEAEPDVDAPQSYPGPASGPDTTRPYYIKVQVQSATDAVQEDRLTKKLDCAAPLPHLILGQDDNNLVGLRFASVPFDPLMIDHVTSVSIDFKVAAEGVGHTNLRVSGEKSANSEPLCSGGALSDRPFTEATADWPSVPPFMEINNDVETPDLHEVLREMISNGWQSGDPLTFFVSGDGSRLARNGPSGDESMDPEGCFGPVLTINVDPTVTSPPDATTKNCYKKSSGVSANGGGFCRCPNGASYPVGIQYTPGQEHYECNLACNGGTSSGCSLDGPTAEELQAEGWGQPHLNFGGMSATCGSFCAWDENEPTATPAVDGEVPFSVTKLDNTQMWRWTTQEQELEEEHEAWFGSDFDDRLWFTGNLPAGYIEPGSESDVYLKTRFPDEMGDAFFRTTINLTPEESEYLVRANMELASVAGAKVFMNGNAIYVNHDREHKIEDVHQFEIPRSILRAGVNQITIVVGAQEVEMYLGEVRITLDVLPSPTSDGCRWEEFPGRRLHGHVDEDGDQEWHYETLAEAKDRCVELGLQCGGVTFVSGIADRGFFVLKESIIPIHTVQEKSYYVAYVKVGCQGVSGEVHDERVARTVASFCPANGIWLETPAGSADTRPCPEGEVAEEEIERFCSEEGHWTTGVNECIVIGTCEDQLMNGDETGVDCGGRCNSPCSFCDYANCGEGFCNSETQKCECPEGFEGERCAPIEDDLCELECGEHGVCSEGEDEDICECEQGWTGDACEEPPLPSCSDGLLNQGEYGLDCGGPCDPCLEPSWIANDWSHCSKQCGTGHQYRLVHCRDQDGNDLHQEEGEELCGNMEKPHQFRSCNTMDCPVIEWHVGPWETCTSACDLGREERVVVCRADGVTIPDHFCGDTTLRPDSLRPCNSHQCSEESFRYFALEWSECSNECGGGIQTRIVDCYDELEVPHNDSFCEEYGAEKLAEERACNTQTCGTYHWNFCPFLECSHSCGGGIHNRGTQQREVRCVDHNDVSVPHILCDGPVPPTVQDGCNPMPCSGHHWVASMWSDCDEDNTGTMNRTIWCEDENNVQVDDVSCIDYAKPDASWVCGGDECPEPNVVDPEPVSEPSSAGRAVPMFGLLAVVLAFLR